MYRFAVFLALLAAAAAEPALGEAELNLPVVHASVTTAAPAIDGVLNDSCWQGCEQMTGFKETYNGGDPLPTEAMLRCDSANLYVAFVCHDPQPELVRSEQKERNADLSNDDYVAILLDPQNSHKTHYHFEVSAGGTQNDEFPDGAADNITWRGDWLAAAKRTEAGWTAEMSIPFHMLRYPRGSTVISFSFRRWVPRLDQRSAWPDLGPNFDQRLFARIQDLKLPKNRIPSVIMPYTVSSSQPGNSFTDSGFDIKRELSNNSTALLTYNPDFTDVQDAVASSSFTYTEALLSEHRPFFREGADLFPDNAAFYSRRVEDIDYGVKSFGKMGKTSFAFLDAMKRGEGNHFASTYAYDANQDAGFSIFLAGSTVEDAYKAKPSDPDSSWVFSPGGSITWRGESSTTTFSARRFTSMNSNGIPNGSYTKASFGRSTAPRNIGYSLGYVKTDSDYYVRDGYNPLVGIEGASMSLNYHDRPTAGRYSYWETVLSAVKYWDEQGGDHHQTYKLGVDGTTRNEWGFATWFSTGDWLGKRDLSCEGTVQWLVRHLYGDGSATYLVGKRSGMDYREMRCRQSYALSRNLALNCTYEWNTLARPEGERVKRQVTLQGDYKISREQSLGIWLVGRNSDLNMCLTYRRTARSGSDIYLIYGYPNSLTTEKRVALKIVRPMLW